MEGLVVMLKVIVAFGILNVWLVRRNRVTPFRGGSTRNIYEEFEFYGLPRWSVYAVGISKVVLALIILAGLVVPELTVLGASGLAFFMLGAVFFHLKVKDSVVQTLPAFLMLIMCSLLVAGSLGVELG